MDDTNPNTQPSDDIPLLVWTNLPVALSIYNAAGAIFNELLMASRKLCESEFDAQYKIQGDLKATDYASRSITVNFKRRADQTGLGLITITVAPEDADSMCVVVTAILPQKLVVAVGGSVEVMRKRAHDRMNEEQWSEDYERVTVERARNAFARIVVRDLPTKDSGLAARKAALMEGVSIAVLTMAPIFTFFDKTVSEAEEKVTKQNTEASEASVTR